MVTSMDWGPLGTALALQASLLCGWLRLTRKMALSGPGPGGGRRGHQWSPLLFPLWRRTGKGALLGWAHTAPGPVSLAARVGQACHAI